MKLRWHQKRRTSREQSLPEISLTPLIDVALTLLIIFMIATPLSKKDNGLVVELPQGNVKETEEGTKEEVVVMINARGTLALNDAAVTKKELLKNVAQLAKANDQLMIFVKGDKGATYGSIVELVDELKRIGGVRYVVLATTKTNA